MAERRTDCRGGLVAMEVVVMLMAGDRGERGEVASLDVAPWIVNAISDPYFVQRFGAPVMHTTIPAVEISIEPTLL